MKHLITTIIFILSLNCFGQEKELFLNSVYKVFVDTSFTKYYLYSHSNRLQIYNKRDLTKDLSEFISIETINELLSKAETDTSKLTWDCKSLDMANCSLTSDGILLDYYLVTLKGNWSEKKQKRETGRQLKIQEEKHEKKPRQERVIYSFSRPIYDSKSEYALISMWMICGNTCGHGCIYLFKKANGIWQLVTETNCYLS